MAKKIQCDYCTRPAPLSSGKEVYPHREDLHAKKFYLCKPCDAYVGCHPGTTQPLGRLANKELRMAKMAAHGAFDQIWRSKKMSRTKAYAWLSSRIGVEPEKCHIGMFNRSQCQQVYRVSKEFLSEANRSTNQA